MQAVTTSALAARQAAIISGGALRRHLIDTASTRADQRWARRKQVKISAIIIPAEGETIVATIRDTSSSGALLELTGRNADFDDVPASFTLSFTCYRTRTDVACAIMRRNGRALGVKFIGSFRTTELPPPPRSKPKPATGIAGVIERVRAVRVG